MTLTPTTIGAESVVEPSVLEGHSVAITIHCKVEGQAGSRLPGISSRRESAWWSLGHNQSGLNHFLDRATSVGIMPFRELAPWL
jgi:hypothetical protein